MAKRAQEVHQRHSEAHMLNKLFHTILLPEIYRDRL